MAVYVTMNLGTFAFILSMEKDGRPVTKIASLNLYANRAPTKAIAMLVLLFSLAGVPPFLGFFAKFGVWSAAIDAGMIWLVFASAIASAIGAYYYLRVIKVIFFDEPRDADTSTSSRGMGTVMFGINTSAIIFIGLFPGVLMGICLAAMSIYGAP